MSTIFPASKALAAGLDGGGEERMTDVQAAKLRELSEELGEPFDAVLTRRQAATRIRELEAKLR